ncbi:hypothetical protein BCT30_07035 [Enterovibrio norvegicus]|uniref:Lipoprotein n=1 Tax=Enterovibrio norvegicus DSM 15893 TaxID=1121869 RepID=A0A1I5XBD4_9GAMM|nr:hypothetical protein [Enterovibrio norvegicus]MCC4797184.1 hypothetical protein [Enterovibrio norvegicus]OEE46812.1 hypothetical protein A1OS_08235 [Enterovibrio norvegicus]OEF59886.1 hypothetical protein A1OW_21200 [Enterovibrio norvegicus]PMI31687.1 hypothetical protein BCU47_15205 [Enterovibrio norvegicus]PMI35320.1 hypothetical protein BCU46_18715 [Enterovibrio norvegicus]
MKSLRIVAVSAILLSGCSYVSTYGVHAKLLGAEHQIIECQYEAALDTLQRFTVVGSNKEKQHAFEYMGVIYQEKMDLEAFNHTVDRFLFSDMGRGKDRAMVITEWNEKRRVLREQRVMAIGQAECATNFAAPS